MFSFPTEKANSCGVLTAYFGKETFTVKKQETDKKGHILIIDVSVNDSENILINSYNANIEKEQINVCINMFALLEKFDKNTKNNNNNNKINKKIPNNYGRGF